MLVASLLGCCAMNAVAQDDGITNELLMTVIQRGQSGRNETTKDVVRSAVWVGEYWKPSFKVFWAKQGVTNRPLEVRLAGYGGFRLFIADGKVLPFVGRLGNPIAPDTIWTLPDMPAVIGIGTEEKKSPRVTDCTSVRFIDGAVVLDASYHDEHVTWEFSEAPDGRLFIVLTKTVSCY